MEKNQIPELTVEIQYADGGPSLASCMAAVLAAHLAEERGREGP